MRINRKGVPKMELKQAVERICTFNGKLPVEEIEFIRANKEDAIPLLLECAKSLLDFDEKSDDDYCPDATFALYLLAEFRVKETFPILLDMLRKSHEWSWLALGDVLTEGFRSILASVMTVEDILQILEVIKDTELDMYHRNAAVESLVNLYVEGVLTHKQICDYLLLAVNSDLENEDFTGFVVCNFDDIHAEEHFDFVRELFDTKLTNQRITSKAFFEKTICGQTVE